MSKSRVSDQAISLFKLWGINRQQDSSGLCWSESTFLTAVYSRDLDLSTRISECPWTGPGALATYISVVKEMWLKQEFSA